MPDDNGSSNAEWVCDALCDIVRGAYKGIRDLHVIRTAIEHHSVLKQVNSVWRDEYFKYHNSKLEKAV